MIPTTHDCVDAAVRDISTEWGGLVNDERGVNCHETKNETRDLQTLWDIGMYWEEREKKPGERIGTGDGERW